MLQGSARGRNPEPLRKECFMHSIFYIIGVVVVVAVILSFLGLR